MEPADVEGAPWEPTLEARGPCGNTDDLRSRAEATVAVAAMRVPRWPESAAPDLLVVQRDSSAPHTEDVPDDGGKEGQGERDEQAKPERVLG